MRRGLVVAGSIAIAVVAALLFARGCSEGERPDAPGTGAARFGTQDAAGPVTLPPRPRERAPRPQPDDAGAAPAAPSVPAAATAATEPRTGRHEKETGVLDVLVVTAGDRVPVAGAEVTVDLAFQRGSAIQKGTTDAEGNVRFRIRGAPHLVTVQPHAGNGGRNPGRAGTTRAVLGPGRCTCEVTTTQATAVRVTVDGAAPGETVHVGWALRAADDYAALEPGARGSVPADADGRCVLHLAAGRYDLMASPADPASALAYTYAGTFDAASGDVEIEMERGARLAVAEVTLDLAPPANAAVQWRASRTGNGFAKPGAHATVPVGAFRSRSLVAPGRWDVFAQLIEPAQQRVIGWGTLTGVESGAEGVVLRIEPGGRVSGRVVAADGKPPIEPTSVNAYCVGDEDRSMRHLQGVRCDAEGTFVLEGLPPWPVEISASSKSLFLPAPRRVEPGATGIELRVEPLGRIRGRIVCEGWEGRLAGDVAAPTGFAGSVRPDGTFELREQPPGAVRLRWIVNNVVLADLGEVTVPTDDAVLTVRLQ